MCYLGFEVLAKVPSQPPVPHFQLFSPRRLAEEAIGAPPSCTSLAQQCNEMTTDFQARDL